jgi:hypothetical protein
MGILRVNHSFNFEKKIKNFCQSSRYKLDEIDADMAFVKVEEEDHKYPVVIRDMEDMVQFSVAISLPIPTDDENFPFPHLLSTMLLQINGHSQIGFWSLEEDQNDELMYMYNCNYSKVLINKQQFDEAIDDLITNFELFFRIFEDAQEDGEFDVPFDEDFSEDDRKHRHEH